MVISVEHESKQVIEIVQFAFSGQIEPASFTEFAQHRAERLDLWLEICVKETDFVLLDVEGDADLVDAFEMACSLGPQNCLVLDVTRKKMPMPAVQRTIT